MATREHVLRRTVVGEMHLRRWPALDAPKCVIQILRLTATDMRAAEMAALAALPAGGVLDAQEGARHATGTLGQDIGFVMERHHEASALTLFAPLSDDPAALPGTMTTLASALDWAGGFPGDIIRATRILILPDEAAARTVVKRLNMADMNLVSCHVGPTPASAGSQGLRLWSDFRIGPGDMGCLVLAAGGLAREDLSRVVQRLQELGNYRNLALLSLPLAQAHWNDLNRIEQALAGLAGDVARADTSDDVLLDKVSALSLDLMAIATSTSFRMSATAAYAHLVEERLAELAPRPVPGYPSLVDFTQRRLLPAVRTCAAHVRREAELSLRADRFAALLRTRIETRIENQNARLLHSMERSATLQLRLQQLVEGFSIVALSYYGLGLISYLLKGAEVLVPDLPVPLIDALFAPAIVIAMWCMVRHHKRRVLGDHDRIK